MQRAASLSCKVAKLRPDVSDKEKRGWEEDTQQNMDSLRPLVL